MKSSCVHPSIVSFRYPTTSLYALTLLPCCNRYRLARTAVLIGLGLVLATLALVLVVLALLKVGVLRVVLPVAVELSLLLVELTLRLVELLLSTPVRVAVVGVVVTVFVIVVVGDVVRVIVARVVVVVVVGVELCPLAQVRATLRRWEGSCVSDFTEIGSHRAH
jgi:hypothetical protein